MAGGDAVAQKEIDLSYNDAGESASIQCILDGNVVLTSDYTYDSLGRLTGLAYHQGNTVLDSFSWTYSGSDAGVTSGDVVSGLETAVGGSWRPGQNILPVYQTSGITADTFNDLSLVDNLITSSTSSLDGTVQYSYDSQGQLTGAAYSGGQPSESYSYDANGNRTNAGYVTGADNELLSDGTYTYTYDAEGNRTAKFVDVNNDGVLDSGDTNVTEYTWDVRNRLSEVKTFATAGGSPTAVVDYLYDAENRWIGENIDSTGDGQIDHETRFVYDGDQIVLQFDKDVSGATALGAADESHRYLWGPAVDQLLADEQVTNPQAPGNVLFALTDNQNTVRDLAQFNPQTATTSIVVHREFNSYGQLVSQTDTGIHELFGYTGRPFDQTTGLQNNLNRWYVTDVGWWLNQDPKGFVAGQTNLYAYCGNSPVNATDPTGLANKTVETGIKGIRFFLEWFPNQATGEIKILTKRGAELAIAKYVLNPKTGQGVVNIVETHAGKVLPGIARSALAKIEPQLARQLTGIVERVGGEWALTRLANPAKTGGRLGLGRAAAGAGEFGIGTFLAAVFAWFTLENTCQAPEIPRPERIWIDPTQLGLTDDEISALLDLVNKN